MQLDSPSKEGSQTDNTDLTLSLDKQRHPPPPGSHPATASPFSEANQSDLTSNSKFQEQETRRLQQLEQFLDSYIKAKEAEKKRGEPQYGSFLGQTFQSTQEFDKEYQRIFKGEGGGKIT